MPLLPRSVPPSRWTVPSESRKSHFHPNRPLHSSLNRHRRQGRSFDLPSVRSRPPFRDRKHHGYNPRRSIRFQQHSGHNLHAGLPAARFRLHRAVWALPIRVHADRKCEDRCRSPWRHLLRWRPWPQPQWPQWAECRCMAGQCLVGRCLAGRNRPMSRVPVAESLLPGTISRNCPHTRGLAMHRIPTMQP